MGLAGLVPGANARPDASSAVILGAGFVTEGAIPAAAADPLRVLPSIVAGAGTAGACALALGVGVTAPHGGIVTLGSASHPVTFLAAPAAGTAVTAGAILLLRSPAATQATR